MNVPHSVVEHLRTGQHLPISQPHQVNKGTSILRGGNDSPGSKNWKGISSYGSHAMAIAGQFLKSHETVVLSIETFSKFSHQFYTDWKPWNMWWRGSHSASWKRVAFGCWSSCLRCASMWFRTNPKPAAWMVVLWPSNGSHPRLPAVYPSMWWPINDKCYQCF